MLLNEMYNNVRFEESGEVGHQFAKFKSFVYVDGKKFEGTGMISINTMEFCLYFVTDIKDSMDRF